MEQNSYESPMPRSERSYGGLVERYPGDHICQDVAFFNETPTDTSHSAVEILTDDASMVDINPANAVFNAANSFSNPPVVRS